MIDIFGNYELQREELLARIAQLLQLDNTRRKRMEDAYGSIAKLINDDQGFFKNIDADVYPQGSVPIGATVKPYLSNEFDLDIVLHIKQLYTFYNPYEIYNALHKLLSSDGRYSDKIELKNRCIRIKYAGDFHMDILPGCLAFSYDNNRIKIPDRELKCWMDSNPKGFINWFMSRANSASDPVLKHYFNEQIRLKADVEDLPDDDFYNKTPLQRSLQLMKRVRDIYFINNSEYSTSSIVLTTLMGTYYRGENSIYDTIEMTIRRIRNEYNNRVLNHQKFKIINPVNENEDFTDSWTNNHYTHFYKFISDFFEKWQKLKQTFEKSGANYIELFGEGIYKQSLQEQIKTMGEYSSNQVTKANAFILSNKAVTDNYGNINDRGGYKNEPHHNYGE